jgi:hypothetical protein
MRGIGAQPTRFGRFDTSIQLFHNDAVMTTRSSQQPPPPDPLHDDPLDGDEPEDDFAYERGARDEGRTLDRILPELIRRGIEAGGKVGESFFPKDIASHVVGGLGDIKSGIVKAVAQEVGRFLREADIASEVRKVLIGLDVEAQVRLRFKEHEDGALKPEVNIDLGGDKKKRKPHSERP